MDAPSTTKGKSGSNSPTSRKFRLSRKAWFFVALGIFIISTIFAFVQPPRRNPFDAKNSHGLRWFYHPIERNASKRLPNITSLIHDIFIVPEAKRIWIAGVGNLLAYSDDGGMHWEQPLMKAGNTPQPEKRAKGAWRIIPDLMQNAYAVKPDETHRSLNESDIIPKGESIDNPEIQQKEVSSDQQRISGQIQQTINERSQDTQQGVKPKAAQDKADLHFQSIYFVDSEFGWTVLSNKKYFDTLSKNNLLNLSSKLRDDHEFFAFQSKGYYFTSKGCQVVLV